MDGDSDVQVTVPALPDHPSGYCRLLYCLGYGASTVCEPTPANNRGTPQYWKIFAAIAWGDSALPRNDRLAWKIRTLEELRSHGVWLVDASTKALYSGGKRMASGVAYDGLVRSSWETDVWPTVEHDNPEQVLVIGRMVGKALAGHPAIREDRIISQPQDRNHARYVDGLKQMAQSIRATFAR